MSTAEAVALQVLAELPVVLQRIPSALSCDAFIAALREQLAGEIVRVTDPLEARPTCVRVLDARQGTEQTFRSWEARRAELGTLRSPLVVLLNAESTRALLRAAPHVASWAGGVQLPVERSVRPAQSEQELRLGSNALSRIRRAQADLLRAYLGRTIGVQLGADRVFVPTLGASALDAAREELDEGIIYMVRVDDEHLVP